MGLFLLSLLIQLSYYLGVFIKLPAYKKESSGENTPPVSVIICARNEEQNLINFLPKVLEQDYPEFEVVVVNDSSSDDTEQVLAEMRSGYSHLRYTSIPANDLLSRGKKLAVTIGLKSAKHEHIVLIDADCYPVSQHWLRSMTSGFGGTKQIVLGYGGYERKKGLLNVLIRFETIFTAIQYLSFAIKGKPYMGVGRNLAYEKRLFFENKGFSSHYHLRSGDDDLFINENATGENTAIVCSPESITRSLPETTFKSWVKQKKRHISAGHHYKAASRFRLALEWLSRILFYASYIVLATTTVWLIPLSILFGISMLIKLIIFKLGMWRLNEKYLLLPSLLLDPLMPVILGLIWVSTLFESKQKWK